jgi:hypothetical protein
MNCHRYLVAALWILMVQSGFSQPATPLTIPVRTNFARPNNLIMMDMRLGPQIMLELNWQCANSQINSGFIRGFKLYTGSTNGLYTSVTNLSIWSVKSVSNGVAQCSSLFEVSQTNATYMAITAYNMGAVESKFSEEKRWPLLSQPAWTNYVVEAKYESSPR